MPEPSASSRVNGPIGGSAPKDMPASQRGAGGESRQEFVGTSVGGRTLDVVDDQKFNRAFGEFELKTELFLP